MNITDVAIRRPVLAWMLMAATLVFGGVAASRIGVSQFPDVDFPTISVSVRWDGASPEVIENDVLNWLEEALVQVQGVRTMTSSARQGSGTITLELDLARSVDSALQDVQTRVSEAQSHLPRDAEAPSISKSNPEDNPIMWVGLSGPLSPLLLADLARYRVKEKLQTVPGVGEVTMGSALERNIRLWMDAEALTANGLTVSDVVVALQKENVELPAGRIEAAGREVNVRLLGEASDLDTLRRVVVSDRDGAVVRLGDVSLVEDGFEDVRRYARVNGEPAQGLGIRKQRGSNAVEVAQGIRKAMDELRAQLPPEVILGINFDSTRFIEESVREIEFEILLAVFLTALVCWFFLGSFSSTLNVILAIPMSLFGTIAVIYFLGYTLNTFTLLGLGLAVGIVVDDAIMVLENIYRHRDMGKDRVRASSEGTKEIAFAALAATLAVVAIFAPVIFMDGIIGKFFLQFGVTLCVAVLLSYLEAVTLAPARCAQLLEAAGHARTGVGRVADALFSWLERVYTRVLGFSLRMPIVILVLATGLFYVAVRVFQELPQEMVPSQDQSRIMIRLQTAVGSSLEETDRVTSQAEAFVGARPEVARTFAVIGGFGGAGVNQTFIFTTLVPPSQRKLNQLGFIGVLRKELNAIPGLRAIVLDLSQTGFTANRGFPIEFSVRGPEWGELVKLANDFGDKLKATGAVVDLDTDYQLGMPELRVVPNREACSDLGVPIESVATAINALVGGVRVGKYSSGGRRLDVRARLLANQRARPEDLGNLHVRGSNGKLVPLSTLVVWKEEPALQAITRKDRERAISFYANVAPGHAQDEALREVESIGRTLPTPYRAVLGGASVTFRESSNSLYFALILGIIVAYMILAAQFNSFLHPVTVLVILPLSIAGAAGALYFTGKTLNIFSMIGLLLLLGIVKKNSIILVDYTNQLRETGLSTLDALLKAGPTRLRPILMTSVATGMAAVPSALALGPGSETRGPMAIAVLGGLAVSTMLSLVVVPAFYLVSDLLRNKVIRAKPAVVPVVESTSA